MDKIGITESKSRKDVFLFLLSWLYQIMNNKNNVNQSI